MQLMDFLVSSARVIGFGAAVAIAAGVRGQDGDGAPGTCCGARPSYEQADYLAFGAGPVAVATNALGAHVLHVIDLSNQGGAPLGTNWNAAPFFHDASWTLANLGSIFGVTLDDLGNIYVAHTSIYSSNPNFPADALGIGGAGAIYKIDAVTAAVSVFATLPNAQDPGVSPASESWPGLGNLNFDCERQVIYATDFEDGRIYRLDTAGNCLSTYDHATDSVGSCAPEPGDGPGFVVRSERVWAVQAHAGRVYYSLWSPSQVWSVACDGSGEFIAGTQQMEVALPTQSPASDISFGPSGCMLVGERTVGADSYSGAHNSEVREYCQQAGSWVPSANVFTVGTPAPPGLDRSSAGGVDYDYGSGGRVWASGDALQYGPQYIYGITGMPATGGGAASSILIDVNQDIVNVDKFQVGDVEITCPAELCLEVIEEEIVCTNDGTGDYTYTITILNHSGTTAHWVLVPAGAGPTISPNVIPLVPPLPGDGSTSATVQLTISGAAPGAQVCFPFSLADAFVEECCAVELCVDLPECDCLQLFAQAIDQVICNPDGTVDFQLCFTLQNLSPDVLEHAFILSQTVGVTFTPDYFDLSSIPSGGAENLCVTITGATPGTELCFLVSVHDANLQECCSEQICVTAPPCGDPTGGCALCDSTCMDDVTRDECVQLGGAYCGDGIPCGPACAAIFPVGACCLPTGECIDLDQCECEASGGIFDPTSLCAAGVACQPPVERGGCLFCDGTCLDVVTFDECVSLGGSYCGDDILCDPACAVTPNGACCAQGSCFDTIGCECEAVGGLFMPFAACDEIQCPLPQCSGDCNADGVVDALDLLGLIAEWGMPGPHLSDFAPAPNGDGVVDALDWLMLIANWGPCD